jgi:hypothetical protein
VKSLIDAGHASLAATVEDFVLVEKEPVGMTTGEQRRLVLGHVAVSHHPLGELTGMVPAVLGLGLPALKHRLRVSLRHEAAANQQAVQVLDREIHAFLVQPREGVYPP